MKQTVFLLILTMAITIVRALFSISLAGFALAETCKFDGNDAKDCTVFGRFDGKPVEWPSCTQDCLDAFKIKIEGVSSEQVQRMFPNPDG